MSFYEEKGSIKQLRWEMVAVWSDLKWAEQRSVGAMRSEFLRAVWNTAEKKEGTGSPGFSPS